MRTALLQRVLGTLPTFLGITFIAFALVRAAPGHPLAFEGDGGLRQGAATAAERREYRRLMGLDDPFLPGYARWLTHVVRGDLGDSFRDGRPVRVLLAEALPVTLLLSLPALLLGYLLAIPIGLISAARPGGLLDRSLSSAVFLLYSLPVQWVALLLVVAASGSGLPIQGLRTEGVGAAGDLFAHLVLPIADVAYVLDRGRITFSGTPAQLQENPGLLHEAYLAATGTPATARTGPGTPPDAPVG